MSSDQRKWHRVRPRGMIFAVIEHPSILVGQIIDISLGGLAFGNLTDEETVKLNRSIGE